jgi:hypothetical protein
MIGVIILIKKNDLKKLNKSNATNLKVEHEKPTNIHGIGPIPH